jgi:hypothetical protein
VPVSIEWWEMSCTLHFVMMKTGLTEHIKHPPFPCSYFQPICWRSKIHYSMLKQHGKYNKNPSSPTSSCKPACSSVQSGAQLSSLIFWWVTLFFNCFPFQ